MRALGIGYFELLEERVGAYLKFRATSLVSRGDDSLSSTVGDRVSYWSSSSHMPKADSSFLIGSESHVNQNRHRMMANTCRRVVVPEYKSRFTDLTARHGVEITKKIKKTTPLFFALDKKLPKRGRSG